MDFDLDKMHGWLVAEYAPQRPIGESMHTLIDHCDLLRPHPDWAKLRALPYSDLSGLREWIEKPFREEPSDSPLKGLWLGLFNPCPDGRTPIADLYVCGSKRFDLDPFDNSWAVGPGLSLPAPHCANSKLLADLYRIAYRQARTGRNAKQLLVTMPSIPCVWGTGRSLFGNRWHVEPQLILNKSKSLGIAVGFDSGDFLLLGQFGPSGLKPPKSCCAALNSRALQRIGRIAFADMQAAYSSGQWPWSESCRAPRVPMKIVKAWRGVSGMGHPRNKRVPRGEGHRPTTCRGSSMHLRLRGPGIPRVEEGWPR